MGWARGASRARGGTRAGVREGTDGQKVSRDTRRDERGLEAGRVAHAMRGCARPTAPARRSRRGVLKAKSTRTKGAPTYLPSASKGSTWYPLRLISSSVRMSDLFEPDIAVPDWIHPVSYTHLTLPTKRIV